MIERRTDRQNCISIYRALEWRRTVKTRHQCKGPKQYETTNICKSSESKLSDNEAEFQLADFFFKSMLP